MPRYLILKLDGPMQAWGSHSFEDFRTSHAFPTRSGLLGLLGACLGIERQNHRGQQALAESVVITVRSDKATVRPELEDRQVIRHLTKAVDFHTVLNARKVDGKENKNPVVSKREYLHDASFTVAIKLAQNAEFSIEDLVQAVAKPVYTPVLGRRSCPLARPLFEKTIEAESGLEAMALVRPSDGVIYTEESVQEGSAPITVRDVPMHQKRRKFGNRVLHVVNG